MAVAGSVAANFVWKFQNVNFGMQSFVHKPMARGAVFFASFVHRWLLIDGGRLELLRIFTARTSRTHHMSYMNHVAL